MDGKVGGVRPGRVVRSFRRWVGKAPKVNEQNSRWLELIALLLLFGILLTVVLLIVT